MGVLVLGEGISRRITCRSVSRRNVEVLIGAMPISHYCDNFGIDSKIVTVVVNGHGSASTCTPLPQCNRTIMEILAEAAI